MRRLTDTEIADLLRSDAVAHLATVDRYGYPHVTPIRFLWVDGLFHLTSYAGRPHLDRIGADPRVGLVVDTVAVDADGQRTQRIGRKYLDGAAARPTSDRMVVTIRPRTLHAVAGV